MNYFSKRLDSVFSESSKLKVGNFYRLNPTDESFEEWPILGRYEPNIVGRFDGKDHQGRYWFNVGHDNVYLSKNEIGREATDQALSRLERQILGYLLDIDRHVHDVQHRRFANIYNAVSQHYYGGYVSVSAVNTALRKLRHNKMIEDVDPVLHSYVVTELGKKAFLDPHSHDDSPKLRTQLSDEEDAFMLAAYRHPMIDRGTDNDSIRMLGDLNRAGFVVFTNPDLAKLTDAGRKYVEDYLL